jgi:anti-sigma regulatory factor (Ser/Thr protein kinase)
MCRVASTVLPSNARSPGRARTWTESRLASWGIDDEGISTLLVSELVTNAVIHARTPATLTVAVASGMIEIGVADHGLGRHVIPGQRGMELPGIELPRSTRLLPESGRGLIIVEALSQDWGLTRNGTGKQVWLRRPLPDGWPFAAACGCEHENPAAQLLPSGGRVTALRGPWDAEWRDA